MSFVDGAVENPGSYLLNRLYTLTQVAVIGRPTRTLASYSVISTFRRWDGPKAEKVSVDLGDILAGRRVIPR